jgi:glyoxylate reductase
LIGNIDDIDISPETERNIIVVNTTVVLTDATADFAFTFLIAAARRVVDFLDYVRAGKLK